MSGSKGAVSLCRLQIALKEGIDILVEGAVEYGAAHCLNMADQKANVVDTQQVVCQQFARLDQMAQIGTRKILTAGAVALGIQRTFITGKLRASDVEVAIGSENCAMSCQT